ncbi:MAG TPA: uroporphyrinogen-III C-methyltransferase [Rubrivivax sp.]|nr:uroporphyrinogen-III C-methyltransferase [Burkholderiales bacterium]HNU11939.1 uroporphyrinogen-III C-methyltransferase [Rubrivivax sp.]
MSDTPVTSPAAASEAAPVTAAAPHAAAASTVPAVPVASGPERWLAAAAALLLVLATAALVLGWNAQQRVKLLEGELVKRQQDSGAQAAEARLLALQAQEATRDLAAKQTLLEARVAETSIQRSQIEELIQSMARSRDENVLADVEAAIRVGLQQSAITGSVDPLVTVLRQADERLARHDEPRLEGVRRAIAADIEKARTAGATDLPLLSLRLDEVIRLVDELPLLAAVDRRPAKTRARAPVRGAATVETEPAAGSAASAVPATPEAAGGWIGSLGDGWSQMLAHIGDEVRSLVRVTRIDVPEAMLIAPEQAFFLRENLKLRLLNARVALLSRQFDIAQSDLRDARLALERYFERGSPRVVSALEAVRQVTVQARSLTIPRPDATLAAISAAAGR